MAKYKIIATRNLRVDSRDVILGDTLAETDSLDQLSKNVDMMIRQGQAEVVDTENDPFTEADNDPPVNDPELDDTDVITDDDSENTASPAYFEKWLVGMNFSENQIAALTKAGVVDVATAKAYLAEHNSFEALKYIGEATSNRLKEFLATVE